MKKEKTNYWTLIAVVCVPILSFVGGMALNAFTIAEKIATKPYVDDRLVEQKKYIDEKSAQTLKEAFEHSDKNRADMLLRIEELGGQLKTDNAILGTKVDSLTKSVQEMRDWQVESRRIRH